MTMVEKVARALWADRYPDDVWASVETRTQDDYRGHARAAIQAMRNPDDGVLQSMASADMAFDNRSAMAMPKVERQRYATRCKVVLNAAIDAILSESREDEP
jgi:hypothetical protein